MNIPKAYLYGTAYFRPPNPPQADHRRHLTKIRKELGFDIIKLRLQWNAIQLGVERFEWDEYDQIMGICVENGLKVLLETNLESAPYWLEREHPESRYVSANGQPMELGPYDATPFGGYPGLCFDHSPVQLHGARFLAAIGVRYGSNPMLVGYDCWNEPHLEPAWVCNYWGNMGDRLFCYCEKSKEKFRSWLAKKYIEIQHLNVTWGRAYNEWRDINPPNRHGNYADWLDWGRFWFDQLEEHMHWRYQTIKSADPGHFVMSHSGAVPPFLSRPNAFIHNWKLAKPVDCWGTSYAPKYHNWDLCTCAGTIEATRSAARGKRFWISEMSGGATYRRGFAKSPLPRPKDYRAWNWLSAVCGAVATIHWCYLEERTGPEATCFGLIRANGQTTPRAFAAAEIAAALHKYQHIIEDYRPREDVGILYDPDNSMQLFAMEGDDELYSRSHIGYYRAVWESDLQARYITYETMEDLDGLKILIMPMCLTLPDVITRKIEAFVRAGGILLAEARTGLFDERGYVRSELPAGCLAQVVGAVEGEAIFSDPENRPRLNNPDGEAWPDAINNGPEIDFEPLRENTRFRVRSYYVPLEVTTGQVVGRCESQCLAVRNEYGLGRSYYFGTYVGLGLAQGDPVALEMIKGILSSCCSPIVRGNRLRPRLIKGRNEALLVVFNNSRSDRTEEHLSVPEGYLKATDIGRNEEFALSEDATLSIAVDPEDVRVFHLT